MTTSRRDARVRLVMLLVAMTVLGACVRLAAADPRKERAAALLREGNALQDRGEHRGALARYQEAQRLYPSYRIEFNASESLEALGEHVAAAEGLERFLQQAKVAVDEDMIASAKRRLAELRGRLASLEIRCALAGARVLVNGKLAGLTPLGKRIYSQPGRVELVVEAAGRRPYARSLWLDAGQHSALTVSLAAAPRRRIWTWVAAGGAGAALATGIVLGVLAKEGEQEYQTTSDDERAEALYDPTMRKARAATAMFCLAGGFAATSLVLYFLEGRRPARASEGGSRAARLWFTPMGGELGLAAGGRF